MRKINELLPFIDVDVLDKMIARADEAVEARVEKEEEVDYGPLLEAYVEPYEPNKRIF